MLVRKDLSSKGGCGYILERQSTLQPTALQELILKDRDIPEAVNDAETKRRVMIKDADVRGNVKEGIPSSVEFRMFCNSQGSLFTPRRNLKWLWLLVPAAVVLSSLESYLVLHRL